MPLQTNWANLSHCNKKYEINCLICGMMKNLIMSTLFTVLIIIIYLKFTGNNSAHYIPRTWSHCSVSITRALHDHVMGSWPCSYGHASN